MTNNLDSKKLSLGTKIGYSVGQATDSLGFNIFYFFFLFFLTDFAGIPPAIAGTISLVAIMWDAISDPIVGYLSDNCKSKYGRRRTFMLGGLIPYSICMFLLFNNINLDGSGKVVYFYAIAIAFWTSYKVFVIPFFALGAEITDDFDERTSLRAWASVFLYCSVLMASSLPPLLLAKLTDAGVNPVTSWRYLGIIFAVGILITGIICWRFTRGRELKINWEEKAKEAKENFFKTYKEVLRLKATIFLGISVLAWGAVSALLSSGPVYLMSNNLGYSGEMQSLYFMFSSFFSIAMLPVINKLSAKFDKKTVYVGTMLIGAVGMFAFTFIGFPTFAVYLIYTVMFALGNVTFWTVYYSMMYDISEVDEFKSGKRREGAIASIMSFFQKLGAAFATWLIGMLLAYGEYDGTLEVQPESAQTMILYINTLVPGIIGSIAIISALLYPVTGKRYQLLMNALVAKRAGKEYTTEGFEKLL